MFSGVFFSHGIWVQTVVAQGQLLVQMETSRILSQSAPRFLYPQGSGQGPLGLGIWAEVVVSPVMSDVTALLGGQLSPGENWVQRAVVHGQLPVYTKTYFSLLEIATGNFCLCGEDESWSESAPQSPDDASSGCLPCTLLSIHEVPGVAIWEVFPFLCCSFSISISVLLIQDAEEILLKMATCK